ncbi:MAG: phenylalanine--tRNA ligase subunit beta [Solirubrobacterales bacterium]
MRVPWSWLTSYCDPGWDPQHTADRLALTGTEVERLGHAGAPTADGFVVGRVDAVDPHPDADKLQVCTVDAGDGDPRTIVCGAPNVAAGQTVAVALPGAVMPGGMEIRKATLRGVASEGMICSEDELGLGADSAGIAVLADGPAPGTPLADIVPLADPVLDLEITPNRPDCLGVHGVARELHAISGADLAADPWAQDAEATGDGQASEMASVRIDIPELCPRFTARVFTDVRVGPSPLWLKQRLMAAGQRPINNVVDITNYVMLLTAQPLHAFDLDLVPGGELIVRAADPGEQITTLDGERRELDEQMVLVCDREQPTGIAGIMGGQVSEVHGATTRVLLEVASWNGPNILRTSNRLGLRSEASARFEKQLHPELVDRAQRVASRLLVELCGARMVPGTIDEHPRPVEPREVELRPGRVAGLLGAEIAITEQLQILERLGFSTQADGAAITAQVPPDRHFDVGREADLIEEIARVHGLDDLPASLPASRANVGGLSRAQRLARRAEDALRDLGLGEIMSWTFTDPGLVGQLRIGDDDPRAATVRIHNPLSEVGSAMRTTLLGGLLDAARHNLARDAEAVQLFESGRVYLHRTADTIDGFLGDRPAPANEPHNVAVLIAGDAPASWRGERAFATDFFAAKGLLEGLGTALLVDIDVKAATEPFLHPGRSARVLVAGRPAGWVGELHPAVAGAWDLPGAAGFEVDLGALLAASELGAETYEDVIGFPSLTEDIAVVVAEETPAATVLETVTEAGGELLADVRLFDLYRGEQLGDGRKSLALRLRYRAPDRTLTDAEVAERSQAITAALGAMGGALRG